MKLTIKTESPFPGRLDCCLQLFVALSAGARIGRGRGESVLTGHGGQSIPRLSIPFCPSEESSSPVAAPTPRTAGTPAKAGCRWRRPHLRETINVPMSIPSSKVVMQTAIAAVSLLSGINFSFALEHTSSGKSWPRMSNLSKRRY